MTTWHEQQLETRLRALLGSRAHRRTVDAAVQDVLEENARLRRYAAQLQREQSVPVESAPLALNDDWTRGT